MQKKNLFKLCGLAVLLFINACDEKECCVISGEYSKGVFVTNEGNFGNGTGTITHYNLETKATQQDIFYKENLRPIGNILQSATTHRDKVYAVVNNAQKVEIVEAGTFQELGAITNLAQPRYFLGISDTKAYISQWGIDGSSGSIKVIDLQTNTIIKTIETGGGPEKMLLYNNKIYAVNSGGFNRSKLLYEIDPTNDTILRTFTIGDNPNSLAIEANTLWVLCGGYNDWQNPTNSTNGSIYKINLGTGISTLVKNLSVNGATHLEGKNSIYYFNAGGTLHKLNTSTEQTTPFVNKYFYGLGYFNNRIYAADAKNFSSNGEVYIFKEDSNIAIDSFETGIIPNGFMFR